VKPEDVVKIRRYAHSKKRAKERYNINLTKADAVRIIELIQKERTKPVRSLSLRKKVHLVHYNNQDIFVVYCKKTKTILTLLPKENIEGVA